MKDKVLGWVYIVVILVGCFAFGYYLAGVEKENDLKNQKTEFDKQYPANSER